MGENDFMNALLGQDPEIYQDEAEVLPEIEEIPELEWTEEQVNSFSDDGIVPTRPTVKEKRDWLRTELRNEGRTLEEAAEVRKQGQIESTEGKIRLWDLLQYLKTETDIPPSRLIRAVGGDRGMHAPLNPMFQISWVGRIKWLPAEAGSDEGLNFLRSMGRAKKEKAPSAEESDQVHEFLTGNTTMEDLTKAQLLQLAEDQGLGNKVSRKMSKVQLIAALRADEPSEE